MARRFAAPDVADEFLAVVLVEVVVKTLMYINLVWLVLFWMLSSGCGRSVDSSETEGTLKYLRIGTFNMLRFGHGEQKNTERLAELILKANYHIFSGIEIMNEDAAVDLRDRLQEISGRKWELSLSKTANGETSYKEYLGFYYRSDLIKPVSSAEGFCASSYATESTENGCFAKDKGTSDGPSFDRDPFVGQFQVGAQRFAIAAVHLFYGGTDSESVQKRVKEVSELKKVVDHMKAKADGYNVMVMGDFNLALDESLSGSVSAESVGAKIPETFLKGSNPMTGLITGPTTIGLSNYDHIFYLKKNAVKHIKGSEEVFKDFNINNPTEKQLFKTEVSDHFPVAVRMTL